MTMFFPKGGLIYLSTRRFDNNVNGVLAREESRDTYQSGTTCRIQGEYCQPIFHRSCFFSQIRSGVSKDSSGTLHLGIARDTSPLGDT